MEIKPAPLRIVVESDQEVIDICTAVDEFTYSKGSFELISKLEKAELPMELSDEESAMAYSSLKIASVKWRKKKRRRAANMTSQIVEGVAGVTDLIT
jgi:hypothetical protein